MASQSHERVGALAASDECDDFVLIAFFDSDHRVVDPRDDTPVSFDSDAAQGELQVIEKRRHSETEGDDGFRPIHVDHDGRCGRPQRTLGMGSARSRGAQGQAYFLAPAPDAARDARYASTS